MRNPWKALLILHLVLDVLIVWEVLWAQQITERGNQLTPALEGAVAGNSSGKTVTVDVSKATQFEWDRLYVYPPYSSCEKIVRETQSPGFLPLCWRTGIDINEAGDLLVFTKGHSIVGYVLWNSGAGDFRYCARAGGYSLNEAKFRIDERGFMRWTGET